MADPGRVGGEQHLASGILDPLDEIRIDAITAIGESGEGRGHLDRKNLGGAQGQCQILRQLLVDKAKTIEVGSGAINPDGLQQSHRDQIARKIKRPAQGNGTHELAIGVAGRPIADG